MLAWVTRGSAMPGVRPGSGRAIEAPAVMAVVRLGATVVEVTVVDGWVAAGSDAGTTVVDGATALVVVVGPGADVGATADPVCFLLAAPSQPTPPSSSTSAAAMPPPSRRGLRIFDRTGERYERARTPAMTLSCHFAAFGGLVTTAARRSCGRLAALRARADEIEAVLGDVEVVLIGCRPGGFGQGPLQTGRGADVGDPATGAAHEMVVVPGEILGQFEASQIVGTGDPAGRPGVD